MHHQSLALQRFVFQQSLPAAALRAAMRLDGGRQPGLHGGMLI